MDFTWTARIFALLASSLLLTSALAASKAELEEAMSHDGLQMIKVKGVDIAYARPGASLAVYDKVMLDPVEVAFRKDWDPARVGSRMKLDAAERENIKSGVAKIVNEEFVRELQTRSSYGVAQAPGPTVLRVRASIRDLYVNAPDALPGGRSLTYTLSAGEMTLVAELYDSETGEVISRVVDRREARDTGVLMLTNSAVNAAEARAIAARWAGILRSRLDAAHGIGGK